jgi:hypothetical protein
MTIEIIPPGSSAVVSEDHGHHDRHGSRHPDRWDLSTQMRDGFTAEALADCRSDDGNASNFASVQKQVSDAATATVVGFKDAAATAYQLQGQALLEASKNAAAISVQSQKENDGLYGQAISNFNMASVQAVSNFNASQVQANLMQYNVLLDSQKNAAASALLATQLAAVAAAQAAECCCELKEKIGAEGQKTRDLICATTEQNLRDRAQRSENALAAYFSGKVPPTAPVI